MRSIAKHPPALLQCLEHELYVSLLKITDTPVHQLCAAAGCSFAEIVGFEQQRFITSRSSLNRCSEPRSTATNDDHIPRFLRANSSKGVFACQGITHPSVCLPALCTFERPGPLDAPAIPLVIWNARGESFVSLPLLCDRIPIGPVADCQACEISGAQHRSLRVGWSRHRDTQQICLNLHEEIVTCSTTIYPQLRERNTGVALHRADDIGYLERNALERGTGDVSTGTAPGQTEYC